MNANMPLSEDALRLVRAIVTRVDLTKRLTVHYGREDFSALTGLPLDRLNDGVTELESLGYLALLRTGSDFYAEPTLKLLYEFSEQVPGELHPRNDPIRTAFAIVALDHEKPGEGIREDALVQHLGWDLARVNLAVASLEECGSVKAIGGEAGSPPVGFYLVCATAHTRRVAAQLSR